MEETKVCQHLGVSAGYKLLVRVSGTAAVAITAVGGSTTPMIDTEHDDVLLLP